MTTLTRIFAKDILYSSNFTTFFLNRLAKSNSCQAIYISQVRNAGHSHWKNIKHTKELNDSLKQKVILDIVRKIKVAVELNGGITNPKLNTSLMKVLDEGKSKDVPSSTMNATLQRLEKGRNRKGSMHLFAARVLGGCSLLIETYTDRPKHTRGELQHVLKKYGSSIVEISDCLHAFSHKGIIYVPQSSEAEELDLDKALEIAVEAGAEEVIADYDDDEAPTYKFIVEPKELHNVKREIEKFNLKPYEARLEYLPQTFVKLDSDLLEYAPQLIDSLKSIEAVVNVYDNITAS